MTEPIWPAAHAETLAHLQAMLRINTVNPPGNELALARYLESVLVAEGIEVRVLEPTPGRGVVIARLHGDGSRQPVLLMAHMDTVGVEADQWSVDPFGGVVRDGYLYGRGAIDDKGMLAVNLVTLLLLKRQAVDAGRPLARDVIFLASADEESAGEWGMGWLLAHHADLLRAEFALNEGGRIRKVNGTPLYVALQNSEKVPHAITLTAHGPGGHASVPLAGTAVLRLGRALAKLEGYREPVHVTPTAREFFAGLARVWPNAREGEAMADVASGDAGRVARGATVIEGIPVLDAVLRNGISATIVSGGTRLNVIPTEATATLNVRTLPGQSIDDVAARLRDAIDDALVTVAVTQRGSDAPPSDFTSPLFVALRDSAQALDPALAVVPYMSTGATESALLRAAGIQCIGVLPFPMDQGDEQRMHGHDERVPLASLEFGLRLVHGAMMRVAR